ncbi:14-3-3 protein [Sodiomyces alkalinus F11]|uniref:14-3-3 protein n=1 Tax=Sodiomyces alkalinus (strain CBS 110278 / VKM F-3762 / F11) TaxID=1314773 RepID=A0A3N2Q8R9_SODAK|nr:14-3-3 protein [Sodiomyces alkalinus F11]ROT43152.1 14-3-3 protein [Sodiomyces alkalinus F11]
MASSEVDQKFLGKLAKNVEATNPLLASMLFKILGLSISLAEQLVKAKKQRRPDPVRSPESLELIFHIIWLSREGLVMLQQYVIPMVGNYPELKVLAYKLQASFFHIFVLFHNDPPVSTMGIATPDLAAGMASPGFPPFAPSRTEKGKGLAIEDGWNSSQGSIQPTHPLEGGPVGAPPGLAPPGSAVYLPARFLKEPKNFLPEAHQYFREAVALADQYLWGSHSLRLSVKTEYAAFMYDCLHDAEGSRRLAKDTIAEVYEATEGMDDDMFTDACELVTVLGRMMKRGLGSSNTLRNKGPIISSPPPTAPPAVAVPPPGMENPI